MAINAFSYGDISKIVNVKTSSIHYYYPSKTDLINAIIEKNIDEINELQQKQEKLSASQKLENLFKYYLMLIKENKICLVGTLASDNNSLDIRVKEKTIEFCNIMLKHTVQTLQLGIKNKEFIKIENAEYKAIEILSTLIGMAQIGRLYSENKISAVMQQIINNLKY
jgi:TetR/AcrR family transcriptional repressor of nem operon